jgi:hypothetical protein
MTLELHGFDKNGRLDPHVWQADMAGNEGGYWPVYRCSVCLVVIAHDNLPHVADPEPVYGWVL